METVTMSPETEDFTSAFNFSFCSGAPRQRGKLPALPEETGNKYIVCLIYLENKITTVLLKMKNNIAFVSQD